MIRGQSCKAFPRRPSGSTTKNLFALVGRLEAALTRAGQFGAGCLVGISGWEAYPGGIILAQQQSPPVPPLLGSTANSEALIFYPLVSLVSQKQAFRLFLAPTTIEPPKSRIIDGPQQWQARSTAKDHDPRCKGVTWTTGWDLEHVLACHHHPPCKPSLLGVSSTSVRRGRFGER